MEIDVGRLIAGKYALVRLLGRGSMGEVWVAHHTTLGEHVAVKLLTDSPTGDDLEDRDTAAKRFLFEAQVAARLSRKTRHIVRVTDHGDEDGLAYLVMELLEGETLESVLGRDGRVPAPTVVDIVTQIARALEQAHGQGVFHRDLKPANVFLMRDEEGRLLVKLLDFGIARAIHAHRLPSAFSTAKGLVFGTPSYMSPEQARGSAKLDQRCDLWALATIAYEALSGVLPVDGADMDEMLKNLCAGRIIPLRQRTTVFPAALDRFFARAFADAIGGRYPTAKALAQAFEAAVTRPVDEEPLVIPEPADSSAPANVEVEVDVAAASLQRRGRARLALVAAGALVIVFAAVGMAWRSLAGPSATPSLPTARTAIGAASVAPPIVPSAEPTDPAVPVSALPLASTHAPPPARGSHDGPPTPPATSTAATSATEPFVAPTPTPPPAPAPTAPAPAPTASKKVDRSEVF